MNKRIELTKEEKGIKREAFKNPFYLASEILEYKDLTDLHRELLDFVVVRYKKPGTKECMILIPRKHFKSSLITIAFCIWAILNNPNIRILINNKNLENAKSFLAEIKGHFENNKKLKYFFGEWKGDIWTTSKINVSRRTKNLKEPTISLGSPDREVTSKAVDLIINDDLVGLKDMISDAERQRVSDYDKSLKYIADVNCLTVLLGTRWHLYDLYNDKIKKLPAEDILIKQAIMNGLPILPGKFTLERLAKYREDDPIIYEAQMNNNPIASELQLYNADKLNYFDIDTFDYSKAYMIGYVDPALGRKEGKKEPCYLAFPIGALVGNDLYLLEFLMNQENPKFNESLIASKIIEYQIQKFGMESNAMQEVFCKNVQDELTRQKYKINVDEINNTGNKERRIEGMHGVVIRNVYFPKQWYDKPTQAFMQITLYPGHKFKDAPDALHGIISLANLRGAPIVKKNFISESTDFYEETKRSMI